MFPLLQAVRKVEMDAQQVQVQAAQGIKKRNPMDDLKREIMIMKKMKHNNIVTLSEVIDDPAGSKLLLVMELMEGGPVLTREALEKREKLPESLALEYFRDMLKVVAGTLWRSPWHFVCACCCSVIVV
jgi:[calcium/calmodulin-dependent protein kinase] kinase